MLIIFKIFYYFCHIVLFSTKHRKGSVLRFAVISFRVTKCKRWKDNIQNCESYINIPSSKIWLLRVYFKFLGCHTTEVHDKWKP
jgi:hypothetical protein